MIEWKSKIKEILPNIELEEIENGITFCFCVYF